MLRVEREGNVAVWTMDRPDQRNALNEAMMTAFADALSAAEADPSLRAVVLTGEGGVFSAGADLREARLVVTREDAARFSDAGEALCRRIEGLPVPVFAALSGVAFGGGAELAMACDARIADASARVSFKHVRMGVCTSWGTLARLVSVVGHGAASRLLLTGQELLAREAHTLRLVDHVTEQDGDAHAVAAALAWARDVEQGSPSAVAAMKRLLTASRRAAYDALRPLERELFAETWAGADHQEAVAAYFERRAPVWEKPGWQKRA